MSSDPIPTDPAARKAQYDARMQAITDEVQALGELGLQVKQDEEQRELIEALDVLDERKRRRALECIRSGDFMRPRLIREEPPSTLEEVLAGLNHHAHRISQALETIKLHMDHDEGVGPHSIAISHEVAYRSAGEVFELHDALAAIVRAQEGTDAQ
ncbi:MAG: hypothetical protein AAGA68_25115 [Pseudomonadota bacterium]